MNYKLKISIYTISTSSVDPEEHMGKINTVTESSSLWEYIYNGK